MIREIKFQNQGSIRCKNHLYTAVSFFGYNSYFNFQKGTNIIYGDIDSDVWGISYLLSMYNVKSPSKSDFDRPLIALVDGKEMHLKELSNHCCYIDSKYYPLFNSKRKTVRQLIKAGLKASHSDYSIDDICDFFKLSPDRVDRPVPCVGNEKFRAMPAIGYACGKEIFCFPWLSEKMFEYYKNHILYSLEVLNTLGAISILPLSSSCRDIMTKSEF